MERTEAAAREAIGTVCTALVVRALIDGVVMIERAWGAAAPGEKPLSADALFDLASLTKLFAGTALLALHDRRRLALDDRVCDVVEEFAAGDRRKRDITFVHLLTHTSGLPAHANFHDEIGSAAVLQRVCATPLVAAPGARIAYSDVGFMLLGEAVARVHGAALDAAIDELVCKPLRAGSVLFRPPPEARAHAVVTEESPRGGGPLRGVVHDRNCHAMGGVAGHAGLFGSAEDVARLGESYRKGGALDGVRVLSLPASRAAVREWANDGDERRGLAWALKAGDRQSCGTLFSSDAYGHTGFTGTSLWVDPGRALVVSLMTNRVAISRDPEPIRLLRARMHDAIVTDLEL